MSGTIPPFLKYASVALCSVETQGQLYFTFTYKNNFEDENFLLKLPVTWLSRLQARYTRVYSKVSALAAWSENCKCYSPLPLGAVVSPFNESV
jgi:hypothetical protein